MNKIFNFLISILDIIFPEPKKPQSTYIDIYTFGTCKEAKRLAVILCSKTPDIRKVARIISKFNRKIKGLKEISDPKLKRQFLETTYNFALNSVDRSSINDLEVKSLTKSTLKHSYKKFIKNLN